MLSAPAFFFNKLAEFDSVKFPQDLAGGEVPTPTTVAILVPCAVQQDSGPVATGDGQKRRGSTAEVRIFFRPRDAAGQAVMLALKVDDRVKVQGRPLAIVLDGPPFDESGRGVVWEATGRDIR